MLTPDELSALDALIDNDVLARRRKDYEAVCARMAENTKAIAEAQAAVRAAQAALTDLAAQAVNSIIQPQSVAEANAKLTQATQHVEFLRTTTEALNKEWRRTHEALRAAHHAAALPIVRHAAALRIEAAERLETARGVLAAAEADYDRASEMAGYATTKGYRPHPHGVIPATLTERELNAPQDVRRRLGLAAERAWWSELGVEPALADPQPKAAAA